MRTHSFLALLTAILLIGLAGACDRQSSESPPQPGSEEGLVDEGPSSAPTAASPAEEPPPASDMDMNAGRNLRSHFAHSELVVLEPAADMPAEFRAGLTALYHSYLQIHDALVADDLDRINETALAMMSEVEALSVDSESPETQAAWAGHRTVLRTSLHQLATDASPESKRSHFSHITEAMYCAIKSFGGLGHPVYVTYCSMALEGHGAYWLSSEEAVHNPYLGADMLTCGELRETLL